MQIKFTGVFLLSIRTSVCTLAGLCAVLFLLAMVPKKSYLPHGMLLPAKHVRAAISPDQVNVYDQLPTADFRRLGSVRVEMAFSTLDAQARDRLIAKVKSLAASVGGNGVIVKILVPNDELRKVLTLMGTVVYIPGRGEHA